MSAFGTKRTNADAGCLSAFGGKADVSHRLPNNRDLRVRRQLDVLKPQALPLRGLPARLDSKALVISSTV
jgi:hypothetical protein